MLPRSTFETKDRLRILVSLGREENGVVAVILALMLAAIFGMMALAVDLGRAWNLQTELQNAADAASLAGATQLDNRPGAIARARLAAETSVNALAGNEQRFATDRSSGTVVITATDIRFLQRLNPRIYIDESAADADQLAEFIEVTVAPRRVDFMFAAVVGAVTSASPGAMAVAGLGQAICLVPPIMICNPDEPEDNVLAINPAADPNYPFDVEAKIGAGILLKAAGNGSFWKPGNFGLLSLSNQSLSVNDIRDALGRFPPLELCFGETVGTKPGQSTAVRQGLNMRFDLYSGVARGLEDNPAYRPSRNPVKGLIKGSQCMWGGQGWGHPDERYMGHLNPNQAYNGPGDTIYTEAIGFPRDKCAYPAPDGPDDCDTLTSGARFGDGDWDIETYMKLNHDIEFDLSVSPTDPLIPGPLDFLDFDGDDRVTRHDVYMWELSDPLNMPAEPGLSNTLEDPMDQCFNPSPPAETNPDRRELIVAVLNCNYHDVKGATPDVPVLMWVKLFMTEPMGTFESNNDLYAEIVERANRDIIGRNIVQLYE
jgi:Flp pilus assembly protein TadG